MKKSTVKVLAGLALAAIVLIGFKRMADKKKATPAVAAGTAAIPSEFSITDGENTRKYWKDGAKFMYQMLGPNIRSTPKEITEAEFNAAYQEFLN